MKVAFRVDSSREIGTGHVMRCLTLAEALRERGAENVFICRDLPGNISDQISQAGYKLILLNFQGEYKDWLGVTWKTDVADTIAAIDHTDWLVVDNYGLDARWEKSLRSKVKKLMAIDDLANRQHECDLLLDQEDIEGEASHRYDLLVSDKCLTLLGMKYALLRSEFRRLRQTLPPRNGIIRNIVVFMGGIDRSDEVPKILTALNNLDYKFNHIDIIIGQNTRNIRKIEELCASLGNTTLHGWVSNMAELMSFADLAIGAGGTTVLERCCLGLVSIVVILASNQKKITEELSVRGALINIGPAENTTVADYQREIKLLAANPRKCQLQAATAMSLVDGNGAHRVATKIFETTA